MMEVVGILVAAVLTPAAVYLGKLLGALIKKAISKVENDTMRALAWQTVLFVEQKFGTVSNSEKFSRACRKLAEKIPGVKTEDIENAVETAVKEMKGAFPKAQSALPK